MTAVPQVIRVSACMSRRTVLFAPLLGGPRDNFSQLELWPYELLSAGSSQRIKGQENLADLAPKRGLVAGKTIDPPLSRLARRKKQRPISILAF
jgi:hypothetical protein